MNLQESHTKIQLKIDIKIEVNTMDSIFKQLFQYGYHDTEITSIDCEGLEVKLNFDKGIYLLDENGNETILSKPMQVILKISSYFDSFEKSFEIKEYGKKIKYLEYKTFKKYLQKESFGISMCYYSKFDSCILFDGGFSKRNIMFSIDDVNEIIIQEL